MNYFDKFNSFFENRDIDEYSVVELILNGHLFLSDIPDHYKTYLICDAASKKDYCAFFSIPDDFKAHFFYECFDRNHRIFEECPHSILDEEMCLYAVCYDGFLLKYVPEYLRTENVCAKAVCSYGESIRYVPKSIKDDENKYFYLCVASILNDIDALKHIPKELINYGFYKEAILEGLSIKDVPKEFHTLELMYLFLDGKGRVEDIPSEFDNYDFYFNLLKNDDICLYDENLDKIFEKFNDEPFLLNLIYFYPHYLGSIPKEKQTPKICLSALTMGAKKNFVKILNKEELLEDAKSILMKRILFDSF